MAETVMLAEQAPEKHVFRRVLPYLRPHRAALAGTLLVVLACAATVAALPPLVGRAADAIVARDRGALTATVIALAVAVVAQIGLARWSELLLMRAGERVVRDLRERAVERLAHAPLRFLEAHRTGDLLRRTTGEVAELALFVRRDLPNLVVISATLLLTAVTLVAYSWLLTLVVAVVFVPPALLALRSFRRGAEEAFGGQAAAEATVAATLTETLTARELLQTSGALPAWLGRVRRENRAVVAAARRTARVEVSIEVVSLIEGAALAVLLGLGAWLAAQGSLGIGAVVVFVLASRTLFEGLGDGSQLIGELQTARTGLARLLDLLESPGAHRADAGAAADADPPPRGELRAEGVAFGYLDGTPVLRGVDLAFAPGDRVAVVGVTGSGKTTLGKLLAGLYRPDTGRITYCGTDLRELPGPVLSRLIALVPQEVHIVTGSVADNLALVPGSPGRAEIAAAVDRLGLRAWADGLPDGLDTGVGVRGERLSAGERQLIGLARAALIDPAVLVLDEATADIDPATAGWVERAIGELCAERTLVVIAHRPATVELLARTVRVADGTTTEAAAAGARPAPTTERP
ncbi:ABC transporter ATP-binding protein [Actinomadura parmotrematis]|uniref:ABC transporter ATP-binding protein/permease n=1 Tax=Actinomadura parmotrematis TaxID=2864039 RepID=A0ABS7FKS9_9ACTN|nr:ABC transporter ATP-binding protein [Actinomadura parmotrematis]MBW8480964.1 ABC transporter ATP-binding protein/permease [Actinomadura parmotrematis]